MENFKLMFMEPDNEQVSINEVSFLEVGDSIEELVNLANKGKLFYEEMHAVLKCTDVATFIKIIQTSDSLQMVKERLITELNMGPTTAQTLLHLPLAEVTALDEAYCLKRGAYYTNIVDALEDIIS